MRVKLHFEAEIDPAVAAAAMVKVSAATILAQRLIEMFLK